MSVTSITSGLLFFAFAVVFLSWPPKATSALSPTQDGLLDTLKEKPSDPDAGSENTLIDDQEECIWPTRACEHYKSCVHLIPHSHMDPLWRKSFQYYYEKSAVFIMHEVIISLLQEKTRTFILGDTEYLRLVSVNRRPFWTLTDSPEQYSTNVHRAFLQERSNMNFFTGIAIEDRKFFQVEMTRRNHTKWKNLPDMSWLQVVKNLVQDGQLDIVGGGIVQHDEALTSPLEAFEQVGQKKNQ